MHGAEHVLAGPWTCLTGVLDDPKAHCTLVSVQGLAALVEDVLIEAHISGGLSPKG